MPGIEKRIARFPQLYSRIGFVHEFRPLGAAEVQELLERCWTPPVVTLPDSGFTPVVVARLVRITGSNLRLLTRLLTQVERVLGVNDTQVIPVDIESTSRMPVADSRTSIEVGLCILTNRSAPCRRCYSDMPSHFASHGDQVSTWSLPHPGDGKIFWF
jgi:hypothetical protein